MAEVDTKDLEKPKKRSTSDGVPLKTVHLRDAVTDGLPNSQQTKMLSVDSGTMAGHNFDSIELVGGTIFARRKGALVLVPWANCSHAVPL